MTELLDIPTETNATIDPRSEELLEPYSKELQSKKTKEIFTEEQQKHLLAIEENFFDEEEWRSMYLRGYEKKGKDACNIVDLSIYMSKYLERHGKTEGWQVRIWDDIGKNWMWQDIRDVIYNDTSNPTTSGEHVVSKSLVLANGQTLKVDIVSKVNDRESIKELRCVEFLKTKFESVISPTVQSHENLRGSIPSKIKRLPVELSPEEQAKRDYARAQYVERRLGGVRRDYGCDMLGASAVYHGVRI